MTDKPMLLWGHAKDSRSEAVLRRLSLSPLAQAVWFASRGSRRVPASALLRPRLHGDRDGAIGRRIVCAHVAGAEAPEAGLRAVWRDEQAARSSQGREPQEQRPVQHRHPLRVLPSSGALERRKARRTSDVGCRRRPTRTDRVCRRGRANARWLPCRGSNHRSDEGASRTRTLTLRGCGNGVVVVQGAAALVELARRAGIVLCP